MFFRYMAKYLDCNDYVSYAHGQRNGSAKWIAKNESSLCYRETVESQKKKLGYGESNPGLVSESHRCYRYTIPD